MLGNVDSWVQPPSKYYNRTHETKQQVCQRNRSLTVSPFVKSKPQSKPASAKPASTKLASEPARKVKTVTSKTRPSIKTHSGAVDISHQPEGHGLPGWQQASSLHQSPSTMRASKAASSKAASSKAASSIVATSSLASGTEPELNDAFDTNGSQNS